jgi:hypothetical protein
VTRTQTIALLAALFAITTSSFATTCIWGSKFKTRKVCGVVRDSEGVEIPDASIQIEKPDTQAVIAKTKSHADGSFVLPDVTGGYYVLRVKLKGFWDASQNFRLQHPSKARGCSHPIRIVMKPAGFCSSVENAWKE